MKYKNQWRKTHKESVSKYQRSYQSTFRQGEWISKYSPIVQKIQQYSSQNKAKYLSDVHGRTRKQIYKYFVIPFQDQIEKEIKKIQNSKYRIKQKPNARKRINKKWEYVQKWMTNKGCSCGEKNISKLSFHHLDPKIKENTIRKMCNYSMKRIKEELKKGIVKCKNCHTIIHIGTSEEREETLINQYLKESTNRKYRYRRKNKLLIWEFKKTLFCEKCGIDDPVVLLFHHINNKLKKEKICLLYKITRGVINKEISKTICMCHNCHEDFHYLYGRKTTQKQLYSYIGKNITPIQIDIRDYLPIIEQNISQFRNLPSLIA